MKWISVKERLPNNRREVLAYVPQEIDVRNTHFFVARYDEEDKEWYDVTCHDCNWNDCVFISYWSELPTPVEVEGDPSQKHAANGCAYGQPDGEDDTSYDCDCGEE